MRKASANIAELVGPFQPVRQRRQDLADGRGEVDCGVRLAATDWRGVTRSTTSGSNNRLRPPFFQTQGSEFTLLRDEATDESADDLVGAPKRTPRATRNRQHR